MPSCRHCLQNAKKGVKLRIHKALRTAPQSGDLGAWGPSFPTPELRWPGCSSGLAHRMGCCGEEAGLRLLGSSRGHAGRLGPLREPLSGARRAGGRLLGRRDDAPRRPGCRPGAGAGAAPRARCVHRCRGARAGAAGRGAGRGSPTPGRGAGGGGGRVDTVP